MFDQQNLKSRNLEIKVREDLGVKQKLITKEILI